MLNIMSRQGLDIKYKYRKPPFERGFCLVKALPCRRLVPNIMSRQGLDIKYKYRVGYFERGFCFVKALPCRRLCLAVGLISYCEQLLKVAPLSVTLPFVQPVIVGLAVIVVAVIDPSTEQGMVVAAKVVPALTV